MRTTVGNVSSARLAIEEAGRTLKLEGEKQRMRSARADITAICALYDMQRTGRDWTVILWSEMLLAATAFSILALTVTMSARLV